MVKWLRLVGISVGLILGVLVILFLAYFLPSAKKVVITGTEVKRMDVRPTPEAGSATRDVRYIVTRTLEGNTLVFRNEDTGWGWPPYFKFDSGDLMGEAVNLKGEQADAVVLIRYYGWRFSFLDQYPNVLSLRLVAPDHVYVPRVAISVLVVLLGLGAYLAFVLWRARRRWRAKRAAKKAAES
ncbi:MAG: DUF1523 family protein [Myxococcota bacterium]